MGNDLKSQAETPQYKDGFQADVTAPNQVEGATERIFSIVDWKSWDRGSDLSMWVWKQRQVPISCLGVVQIPPFVIHLIWSLLQAI